MGAYGSEGPAPPMYGLVYGLCLVMSVLRHLPRRRLACGAVDLARHHHPVMWDWGARLPRLHCIFMSYDPLNGLHCEWKLGARLPPQTSIHGSRKGDTNFFPISFTHFSQTIRSDLLLLFWSGFVVFLWRGSSCEGVTELSRSDFWTP